MRRISLRPGAIPPVTLVLALLLGVTTLGCRDHIDQVSNEPAQDSAVAQNRSVTQSDQRSQPTQADQAAQEEVEYKEEAAADAMEEEEADQAESLADEGERSDTAANIQVSGVDEPDVIKIDGEHF